MYVNMAVPWVVSGNICRGIFQLNRYRTGQTLNPELREPKRSPQQSGQVDRAQTLGLHTAVVSRHRTEDAQRPIAAGDAAPWWPVGSRLDLGRRPRGRTWEHDPNQKGLQNGTKRPTFIPCSEEPFLTKKDHPGCIGNLTIYPKQNQSSGSCPAGLWGFGPPPPKHSFGCRAQAKAVWSARS